MRIFFISISFGLLLCFEARGFSQSLPIKPSRIISFNTSEGTEMNVDVSPDGKTLAFDLLGELYTLPVTGGVAKQLTMGMAVNMQPQWSPDGKMIAYFSDGSGAMHLTLRGLAGTFQHALLLSDEQVNIGNNMVVTWTSDGRFVAFTGSLYGIAGGKQTLPKNIGEPLLFSLDSRSIYYTEFATKQLIRYNLDQQTRTPLCGGLKFKSAVGRCELSPDLHWLAYTADSSGKRCLLIHNVVNNSERILVPCLSQHPLFTTPHFSFSPDSKFVYIGYGGKIHKIDVENGKDEIISFTANVKVDMGALDYNTFGVSHAPFKIKYTRSANASPDGKHLVFEALDKIWIMDLPNGKPHTLAPQPFGQFQPVFSPDSKWVAYVSWCDSTGGQLWRVSTQGGKPEQITKVPGQYQRPAWSPDGKHLAVIKGGPYSTTPFYLYAKGVGIPMLGDRDDPGIGQLQLLLASGGPVRAIADSLPLWNDLSSTDGKNIVFDPRLIGKARFGTWVDTPTMQIVERDLEGKNERVVATGWPGNVGTIWMSQRSISPDGRNMVYSRAEDLYLVPVNPVYPSIIYGAGQLVQPIRFAKGVDPHWEQGGKVLSWSYGNKFYRINPDKVLTAAEHLPQRPQAGPDDHVTRVDIQPDETIDLNVTAPSNYAHGIIELTNCRILTMKGSQVIENGTILIRNGRFTAIVRAGSVATLKRARVIDLTGKTVIPGFVDLHLHMRLGPDVFPQQAWQYLANLAYGVTTARDPSSSYDSYGYAELLQTGQMLGPRLFSSGRAVRAADGMEGILINNPNDALNTAQKRQLLGGTFTKEYVLPTRLQREWLFEASKQTGLNMTNEGDFWILKDIAMLKDGSTGIEHNPVYLPDTYQDVINLFAKSGTWFTPTLQVRVPGQAYFDSKYWQRPDAKMHRFLTDDALKVIMSKHFDASDSLALMHDADFDARIRKAGGNVTLGSHGEDQGIGVHNELWALQMGGLTNMQALQAATIMGAEALGVQKDIGSIEPGKIADLVILNSNPLDDIHNSRDIKYVMKDGILYDGDTLNEIWPVKKKCPDWRLHVKNPDASMTGKNDSQQPATSNNDGD